MDSSFWARMHGGSTHFPIAMLLASLLFDFAGYVWKREAQSRDLHVAGYYALLLGALGSFAAVVSGLMLTRGAVMGQGMLAKHHDFLWPAYALLVGLAVWRLMVQQRAGRGAFGAYLAVTAVASGLMAAAGYWGGELLIGGAEWRGTGTIAD